MKFMTMVCTGYYNYMIHDYTSHFISVLSKLNYISLKTMGMIKNIRRDNAYNNVDDDGEAGITTKSLQVTVVFLETCVMLKRV